MFDSTYSTFPAPFDDSGPALDLRDNCGTEGRVFLRPENAKRSSAGVAQLAEHNVANVVVVGSNPITRSFVLCREGDSGRHLETGD